MPEGIKRELVKLRQQRNVAINGLLKLAFQHGIYIPAGYFTSHPGESISQAEFMMDLEKMIAGQKIAPISAIDGSFSLAIFWSQDVAGYPPALCFQQANYRGFAADQIESIRKVVENRPEAHFVRKTFIPSFVDDLIKLINAD